MRLSEALLLGDSLRTRERYCFLDMSTNPPCGCALGGAALAMGRTEYKGHLHLWPWLENLSGRMSDYIFEDEIGTYVGDDHPSFSQVCTGKYTIEQLADYVRSIEPDEDTVQKMDEPAVQEVYA